MAHTRQLTLPRRGSRQAPPTLTGGRGAVRGDHRRVTTDEPGTRTEVGRLVYPASLRTRLHISYPVVTDRVYPAVKGR